MKIRPRVKFNPKAGRPFVFKWKFPDDFILVIDSNESDDPLFLPHPPKGLVTVMEKLETGDYSCRGFEDKITIERKKIGDLLTCLGQERERFKREIERMASFEWKAIVVEGFEADLLSYHEFSLMEPESVRQSIISIEIRHHIHFYFGKTREDIERWILDRLIKFFRVKREG